MRNKHLDSVIVIYQPGGSCGDDCHWGGDNKSHVIILTLLLLLSIGNGVGFFFVCLVNKKKGYRQVARKILPCFPRNLPRSVAFVTLFFLCIYLFSLAIVLRLGSDDNVVSTPQPNPFFLSPIPLFFCWWGRPVVCYLLLLLLHLILGTLPL